MVNPIQRGILTDYVNGKLQGGGVANLTRATIVKELNQQLRTAHQLEVQQADLQQLIPHETISLTSLHRGLGAKCPLGTHTLPPLRVPQSRSHKNGRQRHRARHAPLQPSPLGAGAHQGITTGVSPAAKSPATAPKPTTLLPVIVEQRLQLHRKQLSRNPHYRPNGVQARLDKKSARGLTHTWIFTRVDSGKSSKIVPVKLLNTALTSELETAGCTPRQIANFSKRTKHASSSQSTLPERRTRGHFLGSGSFGVVKFAEINGRLCVVKKNRREAVQSQAEEFQKHKRAGSRISPSFYGQTVTVDSCGSPVIMNFMALGAGVEGFELLTKMANDRSMAIRLVTLMAQKLMIMHRNGVAHCDLKWENTLVSEDDLRIIDFGFARQRRGTHMPIMGEPTHAAIPAYRAPEELFVPQAPNFDARQSDVWGLGVMLLEAVGRIFRGDNFNQVNFFSHELSRNYKEGLASLQERVTHTINNYAFPNPETKELIAHMLQVRPGHRPLLPEVIERLDRIAASL